jgi:hypothetical protein
MHTRAARREPRRDLKTWPGVHMPGLFFSFFSGTPSSLALLATSLTLPVRHRNSVCDRALSRLSEARNEERSRLILILLPPVHGLLRSPPRSWHPAGPLQSPSQTSMELS